MGGCGDSSFPCHKITQKLHVFVALSSLQEELQSRGKEEWVGVVAPPSPCLKITQKLHVFCSSVLSTGRSSGCMCDEREGGVLGVMAPPSLSTLFITFFTAFFFFCLHRWGFLEWVKGSGGERGEGRGGSGRVWWPLLPSFPLFFSCFICTVF